MFVVVRSGVGDVEDVKDVKSEVGVSWTRWQKVLLDLLVGDGIGRWLWQGSVHNSLPPNGLCIFDREAQRVCIICTV